MNKTRVKLEADVEVRARVSKIIKQVRGERSQRKFAKDFGVSFAAIRSWEECENGDVVDLWID